MNNWRLTALARVDQHQRGLVSLAPTRMARLSQISPRVHHLTAELLGCVQCIEEVWWGDAMIAHVGPNQIDDQYWHVDGDFFRHFLDSPEQGLLTIVLWSDIAERDGPTVALMNGVGAVAKILHETPEGLE